MSEVKEGVLVLLAVVFVCWCSLTLALIRVEKQLKRILDAVNKDGKP